MTSDTPSGPIGRRAQLEALDLAVYGAIAATDTPDLDRDFERLSRAADHSKLWIASAGGLALTAGRRGRRAAVNGLVAVAVTSAVVNLVAKPLGGRRRPDRLTYKVPPARHVPMPRSTSFPSGHSASAFAFATGVAEVMPAAVPLQFSAALVAYSRVHTGVHYPADVIVGALIGSTIAPLTSALLRRARAT
ncbi:MAG TPA: phosphatase PAP2 family protein [Thermoleophilaceae bacterium]|jgi:membrane-associated phospholipid phosphatase|nr:phosphatase PAP2 family protein [Thermoleophilaceae bacterium]